MVAFKNQNQCSFTFGFPNMTFLNKKLKLHLLENFKKSPEMIFRNQ